ncbi:MAG: ChaN family lipoprotein [Sediminibacterium sp.]|nr:ChaN family lipoprotein [Sediminibacterium sp.]MDP3667419.1 ChaN family lipoprotein [Sediminibacterium sp.]
MKTAYLFIAIFLLPSVVFSQQKPAYILYNAKGKKIGYEKMISILGKKDIVLFGEFHNNPITHWLQLEVTTSLKQTRDLVLGAEMFEQDNQPALDLYLQGKIKAKGLDSLARLWKNYPTDYAPLVNFAKEHNLAFAASNVPRRYASLVAKGGFEALDTISAKEKQWLAPLPIVYDAELPGYKKMIEMMGGHGGANLPKAQAIKDATMAHFILQYYKTGSLFIHYNGSYHSDNYEGILWYLKNKQPGLKYGTITTVSQKDITTLLAENKGKADFIICVDENMTTTY